MNKTFTIDASTDLSKLSHVELANIARIIREQEAAYDDDRLSMYKPHPGQVAFHKSSAKVRLLCTGNRFGKTTASIIEVVWLALGIHPYHKLPIPNRGKIYGESFPVIMETIAKKITEWVPQKFLAAKRPFIRNQMGHIIGINWSTGSQTMIGSYDQMDAKAEGSDWDYIMFDEPPPRELYIANFRGLIDRGILMWFSMTPLKEAWIYDDLWMPGINKTKSYIECFSGRSSDNPHINKEALDLFLSELTEEEREVRFEGRFKKLKGLVIDTYEPDVSDIRAFKLDHTFSIYEGIDPHPRKPHSVLWKAINAKGQRFVVRELSCTGGAWELGQQIAEIRQELREHGSEIIRSVSDTSLNVTDPNYRQNLRSEVIESLRAAGESLFPYNAQKRDWLIPGINKLRDLYRATIQEDGSKLPTQFIFKSHCPKYRNELLHYQWPDDPNDTAKPIAKFNEFIDCDRYIESVAPQFQTPGQSSFVRNNVKAYTTRLKAHERYQISERL